MATAAHLQGLNEQPRALWIKDMKGLLILKGFFVHILRPEWKNIFANQNYNYRINSGLMIMTTTELKHKSAVSPFIKWQQVAF